MIPDYVLDRIDPGDVVVYSHSMTDPNSGKPVTTFFSGLFSGSNGLSYISATVKSTDPRVSADWDIVDARTDFLFGVRKSMFEGRVNVRGLRSHLWMGLSERDQRRNSMLGAIEKIIDQFPRISNSWRDYARSHEELPTVNRE